MDIVYFSNYSNNTHRFVEKLDVDAHRIPVMPSEGPLEVTAPYILAVPTYGGGRGESAVPKQVVKFLNNPDNRALIRGVVATGNTNFGAAFCLAGDIIARKCNVPVLYRLEILGTDEDVAYVQNLVKELS